MKTYKITKNDLDSNNYFNGPSFFDGNLEIERELGTVIFRNNLVVVGNVRALVGSGIKVNGGIDVGVGIDVGRGIKADDEINAGLGIKAGGGINAGYGVNAGRRIDAGWGIKAGEGIKAGLGIEAGWGIEAGLGIEAKTIDAKFRIFAGICSWKIPNESETEIRVEKLLNGTIGFGKLVLTKPIETIQIGDLKFDKVQVEKMLMNLKPLD